MATQGVASPRESARRTAAEVEGWLTDREGECLFDLAAACRGAGVIVEIGSWKGRSTVWIGAGARAGARPMIFAIDPHEGSLEDPDANTLGDLRSTLTRAGLAGSVTPLVARSDAAAPSFTRPIEFLFIDGNHEEAIAARDLADWLPKLVPGGWFAMHDVLTEVWPGPRRALRRVLWRSREIADVRFVDTLACGRKLAANTIADRLRNRALALLLVVYDVMPRHLPPWIANPVRAVYRLTPLKGRPG
jgi:predicted O-methyltransferase YrrM